MKAEVFQISYMFEEGTVKGSQQGNWLTWDRVRWEGKN